MNYKPRLLVILDFNENGLFDITMEAPQNYYEGAFETPANIRERDVMNEVFQNTSRTSCFTRRRTSTCR